VGKKVTKFQPVDEVFGDLNERVNHRGYVDGGLSAT
jgi:hypothetical protein